MRKILKGHNSVKKYRWMIVLVLCTSSNGGSICPKFYENILNGIKVIEWT